MLETKNKITHDYKTFKVKLQQSGCFVNGAGFDTMLAAYLLDPGKTSFQLHEIVLEYIGKNYKVLDNAACVEAARLLTPVLLQKLKDNSLDELFNTLELPVAAVLADMECAGVTLDVSALKEISNQVEKRLTSLIEEIYALSGGEFNINSPKQLREVLFEKLKLPIGRKSKTGPSTDEEVLKKLAKKHPLPHLLLEYRQLAKLKNTYIDVLPTLVNEKTGKIHASFNQTGTETGRLSSSNPNLQNIPVRSDIGRSIRKTIVPSSQNGWIIACDYSQIELRIMAHLSQDKALIEAFNRGGDIHRATAALLYNVEEKDVDDLMRDVAKRVNFGILYGQTAFGLSRDQEIPFEEAQQFIDAYFLRYPGVKAYVEKQIQSAQSLGYVKTILGRKRMIPHIDSKNTALRQFAQRQAVNTPIQGSASDLIKLAMVEIHRAMRALKLSSQMIIQVHDELVFDVVDAEKSAVIECARTHMEQVMQLSVPIRVDIKQGKNWLDTEVV